MPVVEVQKVASVDDRTLPIFAELDRLADRIRHEAYKLFARRGSGDGRALDDWLAAEREVCWPAAALVERKGEYIVKVPLAGFEPAHISVVATPQEIIVKASRKERSSGDGETTPRWSGFRSNDVFKRVALPVPIDVEKTSATFKHGLLEIVAIQARPATRKEKKEEKESGSRITVSAGA